MIFKKITKEEMKNNIFTSKDFPDTIGISSKWLLRKEGFYALIDSKGELITIANIQMKKDVCKLRVLETKPQYRRQGYGKKMLDEVENIAIQEGKKEIRLCPRDYRVYDFYMRNGFEYKHEHLMIKRI